MSRKTKPRKSAKALQHSNGSIVPKLIDNPKNLPTFYVVVRDAAATTLETLDQKLIRRGMKMVRPLQVFELARKTNPKHEICVALEKL